MFIGSGISVCGLTSGNQAASLVQAVPSGFNRMLMLGIPVTSETIRGIPSPYPHIYPAREKWRSICQSHPNVMNMFHLSSEEKDPDQLASDVLSMRRIVGEDLFHGVQFNMVWPHLHTIASLSIKVPRFALALQVGQEALDVVRNDPDELAYWIREKYCNFFDYVLLDLSGGRGKHMDAAMLDPYIRALRHKIPRLHVMVAGGLGPATLHLLRHLVHYHHGLGWCAYTNLQTRTGRLSLARSKKYMAMSHKLLEFEGLHDPVKK